MKIWLNGKKQSLISRLTNDKQNKDEVDASLLKAEQIIEEIVEKIKAKAVFLSQLAQPASFR